MADEKKIEVTIDGHNFTIIGKDDEDYIRNVSYYVDKRIKQLVSKNDKLSPTMAATLAALNIADELHKLNEEHKSLKSSTKAPLEEYEQLVKTLEDANQRIAELEKQCLDYKDEAVKGKLGREDQFKEINSLKEKLESKSNEIKKLNELNKVLQDKNLENQRELLDFKRQFNDIQKTMRKHKK